MEIENSITFQEKIDEILSDTEKFVSATKQLNNVRDSLDQYIQNVSSITKDLGSISKKAYNCVEYAGKFFKGDFTKEIKRLLDDMVATAEMCAEEGIRLKDQYDELLKADNFTELQVDHADILDSIGEVLEKGNEIKSEEQLNGRKLDMILKILEKQK